MGSASRPAGCSKWQFKAKFCVSEISVYCRLIEDFLCQWSKGFNIGGDIYYHYALYWGNSDLTGLELLKRHRNGALFLVYAPYWCALAMANYFSVDRRRLSYAFAGRWQ